MDIKYLFLILIGTIQICLGHTFDDETVARHNAYIQEQRGIYNEYMSDPANKKEIMERIKRDRPDVIGINELLDLIAQYCLPTFEKWAKKNDVKLYIGAWVEASIPKNGLVYGGTPV